MRLDSPMQLRALERQSEARFVSSHKLDFRTGTKRNPASLEPRTEALRKRQEKPDLHERAKVEREWTV